MNVYKELLQNMDFMLMLANLFPSICDFEVFEKVIEAELQSIGAQRILDAANDEDVPLKYLVFIGRAITRFRESEKMNDLVFARKVEALYPLAADEKTIVTAYLDKYLYNRKRVLGSEILDLYKDSELGAFGITCETEEEENSLDELIVTYTYHYKGVGI